MEKAETPVPPEPKINYRAVAISIVALQILGAIYYSPLTLGPLWMSGVGKTMAQLQQNGLRPYGISLIGSAAMVYILARLFLRTHTSGAWHSMTLGFTLWLGFVLPLTAIHSYFSASSKTVLCIDSGHALLALLLSSFILGRWTRT